MTTVRLRSDDLTWQALDGEVVVLDLRSSKYFVVNGSGAVLWERLARDVSSDELTNELLATYDVQPADARGDVDAFLEDLRRRGLLEAP